MLSSKPRPVPTKAALRYLYQLAYISSGTAVGVAALCAEERRRRTQIVQRIAENAKKIRQSPRYFQNAALAVPEAREDIVGSGVYEWVEPYREDGGEPEHRKAQSRRQLKNAEDAVRGPELPSAVEAGYEQVRARTPEIAQAKVSRSEGLPQKPSSKSFVATRATTASSPADIGSDLVSIGKPLSQSLFSKSERTTHRASKQSSRRPSQLREAQGSVTLQQSRQPKAKQRAVEAGLDLDWSRSSPEPEQTTDWAKWQLSQCRDLLANAKVQEAADLVMTISKDHAQPLELKHVVSECFDAALAAESLPVCCSLLDLREDTASGNAIRHSYDALLQLCDAKKSYSLILDVFGLAKPLSSSKAGGEMYESDERGRYDKRRSHRLNSSWKTDRSNEIIAYALTQMPSSEMTGKSMRYFTAHFRRVPLAMRARILESRTYLRIRTTWHTTRNIRKVRKHYDEARKWLHDVGDETSLGALERTMLDITISANALDEALGLIAKSNTHKVLDAHSVAAAAVVFAKKGAWELLDRLLSMMANEPKGLRMDADSTRKLNNTIHLIAQHHDTTETWKFVTAAVDNLGFAPNQATSEIMLQSFVSRKMISLIPKWIRYMRILGYQFILDARVAAKLLTRFYLDHRPSHVMIMWFCRNLAHAAPSLAGPEFMDLVKEAIGHDLKKMVGTNAAWRRSHATQRSARLDGADGVVPSPGWQWDRQLHFTHPDPQTVAPPAPNELTQASLIHSANSTQVPWRRDATSSQIVPRGEVSLQSEPKDIVVPHEQKDLLESDTLEQDQLTDLNAALDDDKRGLGKCTGDKAFLEGMEYPDKTTDPDRMRYHDLRSSYRKDDDIEPLSAGPERNMVLAMSLNHHQKVMDLYRGSLDAMGLPASPMALELAVEASLRKNAGDSAEAEDIMEEAKELGMNVTCAMGPLLTHRMRRLRSRDKKTLSNLRTSVIDYYRMNAENGWPVKHHVGVTAANLLIHCGQPEYAVNVMSTIHRSGWAIDRPLDIVAMSVFLKGYVALGSVKGILWTIRQVLENNMRIDPIFLHTLKATARRFSDRGIARRTKSGVPDKSTQLVLVRWIQECYERRAQQMLEAKLLGKKLVATLARCANERPAIDVTARHELEDSLFGERAKPVLPEPQDQDSHLGIQAQATAGPQASKYLERRKARMAKAIRAERVLDKRHRRHGGVHKSDVRWLRQYRAFLRHDLVMPDRKLASFRYRLADDPENTVASKEMRRASRSGAQSSSTEI